MPFTVPSHAAVVLPLIRRASRWLEPVALVVGTCAPDLGYLIGLAPEETHTFLGLWTLSLPIALAAFLWTQWVLLPLGAQVAPRWLGVDWPELFRAAPRAALTPGCTGRVVPALIVGAATHLLWDGLTHEGWWPASVLYPGVRVGPLLLTDVLWWVSTLGGAGVVWRFVRQRHPLRGHSGAPRAFWYLLAAVGIVVSAAAVFTARSPRFSGELWYWVPSVAGVIAGILFLSCWRLALALGRG